MVKRWDFYDDLNGMRDFRNGRYVLFSDYNTLAERCERLEAALRDVIGWVPFGDSWHTGDPAAAVKRARDLLSGSSGGKE